MRGTVLAEGIGEELTTLPAMPKCTILVAKPPISVSTKEVYEAIDAKPDLKHPDIDGIIDGLKKGSLEAVAASMGNVLEEVTGEKYPVIGQIEQVMKENGALNALMSGSGPTVFGIYKERSKAKEAARKLRKLGYARQEMCIRDRIIKRIRRDRHTVQHQSQDQLHPKQKYIAKDADHTGQYSIGRADRHLFHRFMILYKMCYQKFCHLSLSVLFKPNNHGILICSRI